jgi:GntR family transcriptional regulator
MTVDQRSIGPAAEEARRRLLDLISTGRLQPGERLGAERDLALELGVSRSTVRQALGALEETGVVRRVPGRGGGTFVRQQKVERDLSQVVGVPALLRQQGMTAGSRVVSTGLVGADEGTAAELGLATGDYVFDVVRIRLADGIPISLERVRLPAKRFPGLLDLPLGGSMYELLEEHFDTRPGAAVEHIEVVSASDDEASILSVDPGAPLLSITRTTRDQRGAAFEHSHDLFRADRTVITVHTPAADDPAGEPGRVVQLRAAADR